MQRSKAMCFKALLISVVLGLASPAFADQNYTINPNGKISFKVSTTSVTRVRFIGYRVQEIVSGGDAFEHKNNADSGDVFFKRVEGAKAQTEEGYFITEKGVTVRVKMVPSSKSVEDVVITVTGSVQNASGATSERAVSLRLSSRSVAGGNGYKSQLIEIVKFSTICPKYANAPDGVNRLQSAVTVWTLRLSAVVNPAKKSRNVILQKKAFSGSGLNTRS